jgi:hypothetical protein
MSFDPHARRMDRRWLFPAIETNQEKTSDAPNASPSSLPKVSSNDPSGPDFDQAIEQLAMEKCGVCPLCGATVAGDGSVVD